MYDMQNIAVSLKARLLLRCFNHLWSYPRNYPPVGLDVHVHRDPPLRHGSGGVWFDDISEVAVGVGLSSQVFHVETLETLKVDKVSASSAAEIEPRYLV